jgi:hypothetical protein
LARGFRCRILPGTATLPPLFAVQRLADGQWRVRTQMGDPILPGSRQKSLENIERYCANATW